MTTLHEHPLFPCDGEPSRFANREIQAIQVWRAEGSGKVQVPRLIPPEELRGPEDVFERWGGGSYELWAYGPNGEDGTNYRGRLHMTRLAFPGPPKPLYDVAPPPSAFEPAASAAAVQRPAEDPAERWLKYAAALVALATPIVERMDRRASEERERSDRQFALVLQSQQESSRAMIEIMASSRSASGGELAAYKAGQADQAAMLVQQFEAQQPAEEAASAQEPESIMETIGKIAGTGKEFLDFVKADRAASAPSIAAVSDAARIVEAVGEGASAARAA